MAKTIFPVSLAQCLSPKINVCPSDRCDTEAQSDGDPPLDALTGAASLSRPRPGHAELLWTGRVLANQCGKHIKIEIESMYLLAPT